MTTPRPTPIDTLEWWYDDFAAELADGEAVEPRRAARRRPADEGGDDEVGRASEEQQADEV